MFYMTSPKQLLISQARHKDPRLVEVLAMFDAEQYLREIGRYPCGVLAAMVELVFVCKRQDGKVSYPQGVHERRVERVQAVMVSVFGEQSPTLFLTVIPQGAVINVRQPIRENSGSHWTRSHGLPKRIRRRIPERLLADAGRAIP